MTGSAAPKENPSIGTLLGHVTLAGIANSCGQTVGHPFDLLKLRVQVQGRGTRQTTAQMHYKGVWHGLRCMVREEGVKRGLYSAWRVSVAREMSYSGIRVGLYEPCKELAHWYSGSDMAHAALGVKIAAGAASGALASTLCNPIDIFKVRYQAASGTEYAALPPWSHAMVLTVQKEGLRTLWRGCAPNVLRATLITAVQMSGYDHTKQSLLRHGWLGPEGKPVHVASSVVASLLCILVTNPVDVLKTRMMAFPTEYHSMLETTWKVFKSEGPLAFYKGGLLAWLRLGPHITVTFVVLEQLRRWCGIRPL